MDTSLHLKSQEGPAGHALDSNAVLCTADKTYTLRQVSTSNEVYLAHTASSSDGSCSQIRLAAIAKCNSTLELQAAKNVSAIPYIKAVLPTYTTTGHYESKDPISKAQLFANIPLSDTECEQAWRELACFETEDSRALIPSNGVRLQAWEAVLTSATATGIDVTQQLDERDLQSFVDEHEEWLPGLIPAMLLSMATQTYANEHEDIEIEETKCARTVGDVLLRERTQSGRTSMSLKAFTGSWADLLPEKWRMHADISLLEGLYRLNNDGQGLTFVESGSIDRANTGAGALADAKSTLGAKRKWHEKFRASKKTA